MPTTPPTAASPLPTDAPLVAARDAAVFCDLGRVAVLAVAGPDATAFLHGQLSIDVQNLAPGACRYATYNSPKGRMLANLVLWHAGAGADGYRMLLPTEIAEPVRKRLAMFVLRSKVTLSDVTAGHARLGVGGPGAAEALRAALRVAPEPNAVARTDEATLLGLGGSRFVVVAPVEHGARLRATLAQHMAEGDFAVWQWLTIRAGVPIVTAATQDAFVAQTANLDLLGGVDFNKGCYTGQEVIARMQYLGRQKERAFIFHLDRAGVPAGPAIAGGADVATAAPVEPGTLIAAGDAVAPGTRLYNAVFAEQPCGTVVNAARAPDGGVDLIAVAQLAAVEHGDTRLGNPMGPALVPLPLPYELPAPAAPRGRIT